MINAHSTPEVTPSLSHSAWSSRSARAARVPRIGLALAGLWFAAAIGCVPTNARVIGVLITDHNVLQTLKITDRAYIVTEGAIFRSGTPALLAADEEVRRIYLGADFRLD